MTGAHGWAPAGGVLKVVNIGESHIGGSEVGGHGMLPVSRKGGLMKDQCLAYGIFRLTLGINIFIHGTVRIFGPGAHEFASSTAKRFLSTPLPLWAVYGFLFVLPFVETVLGVLVAIGLFTRWSLVAGGLLIAALILGTAFQSDWPTVGVQMIYSISYFALLYHLDQNGLSLDALRTRTDREQ
jgi:thiosulfate dehydrogenase [quinone] large subunit